MHPVLLARLDTIAAPTFRRRELASLPDASWSALRQAGVLVEAETPTAVEVAPARWLAVHRVGEQLVGFDEGEECPSPEPLTGEAVLEYRLSVPALLAHVRRVNAIEGRATSRGAGRLHAIGRKQMPGAAVVQVWLALHLGTPDEIGAQLALLAHENSHAAHVVVFPVWPDLPPTSVAGFARARVHLADFETDSFRIRWPSELQADSQPAAPDYALIAEGATWRIHFLGEEFTVRAVKGMLLLARLLDNPSATWTPLELERGFRTAERDGSAATDDEGLVSADEIGADLDAADPKQIAIYRQELARLQRQLANAEADARELEIIEASQELADWQARMQQAVGLGGRARLTGARERARKNVSKLLGEALDRIAKANARVGKHLRHRVRLGSSLTYTPDPGEVWHVRFSRR